MLNIFSIDWNIFCAVFIHCRDLNELINPLASNFIVRVKEQSLKHEALF